ncbi:MAG: DUF1573 domain-containing protein [Planctomycetota bacterium]
MPFRKKEQKRFLIIVFILFPVAILTASLSVIYIMSARPQVALLSNNQFNFGQVEEGEVVEHSFWVQNTGRKDLIIDGVKASCGCTGAEINSKILAPKSKAELKVTYRARSVTFKENIFVWLISNDPRNPVLRMSVTGRVKLNTYCYPKAVSFYEEFQDNATPVDVKLILNEMKENVIKGIGISSKERISAKIVEDEEGLKCRVFLNRNISPGSWTEKVKVFLQIDNKEHLIEIPVFITVLKK